MPVGFEDDPHSQDGKPCPRNFFAISSYAELKPHEGRFVQMRATELLANGMQGKFDIDRLRKIHRYLFQDVFPWAGEFRVVGMAKAGGAPFAPPRFLEQALRDLFTELRVENTLVGLSREEFAKRAGYYWGEMNAVHPFREGNGRTQREFLRQLGEHCGYVVSWARLSEAENRAASILAHVKKDSSWLGRLMLDATTKSGGGKAGR